MAGRTRARIALTLLAILAGMVALFVAWPRQREEAFRHIELMPGGMNGIGPMDLVVLDGIAHTMNARNASISAVDLSSGKVINWTPLPNWDRDVCLPTRDAPNRDKYAGYHYFRMTTDGRYIYATAPGIVCCLEPRTLKVRTIHKLAPLRRDLPRTTSGLPAELPIRSYAKSIQYMQPFEQLAVLVTDTCTTDGMAYDRLLLLEPKTLKDAGSAYLMNGQSYPAWGTDIVYDPVLYELRLIPDGMAIRSLRRMATSWGRLPKDFVTSPETKRTLWIAFDTLETSWTGRKPGLKAMITPGKREKPLDAPIRGGVDPRGRGILRTLDDNRAFLVLQNWGTVHLASLDLEGNRISPWSKLDGWMDIRDVCVDGRRQSAYLTDFRNNCIRVVDLKTMKQTRCLPVGLEPLGVWYDRREKKMFLQGIQCGQRMWTLDSNSGRLSDPVDLPEEEVYQRIPKRVGHLDAWEHESPLLADMHSRKVIVFLGDGGCELRDLDHPRRAQTVKSDKSAFARHYGLPLSIFPEVLMPPTLDDKTGRLYTIWRSLITVWDIRGSGEPEPLLLRQRNRPHVRRLGLHLTTDTLVTDFTHRWGCVPEPDAISAVDLDNGTRLSLRRTPVTTYLGGTANERTGRAFLLAGPFVDPKPYTSVSHPVPDPPVSGRHALRVFESASGRYHDRQLPGDERLTYVPYMSAVTWHGPFINRGAVAINPTLGDVVVVPPTRTHLLVYKDALQRARIRLSGCSSSRMKQS